MEDLLKTKETQETAKKYADIIHRERPVSEESLCKHPRMLLENRAKIFSPFAALRGYEQKIAAEGVKMQRVEKQILSEEETEKLSQKLNQIVKGMYLTVTYFKGDSEEQESSSFGFYQELTGKVETIDPIEQTIRIDGITVKFEDIFDVAGEMIRELKSE